ncbi:DUF4241 domain-containing protein [Actinomyces oris]|uniref:DUF4241 domain-containing protein n=1 Tax=Actinomyces oris TaxID=544580 RepID=A0A1Q8X6H4_9ACTO|nr:DUF4241 domain-containing protein [Actinomyces oris]OLO75938.1 hypothetical protein BKH15_08830 [Actinomyces oris]
MDPRARIEAFLADYAAAHAEVKPLFDNREKGAPRDDFDAWRKKLREIDAAHRNGEFYRQYAFSFCSSPDFSPDTVEIEKIEVYGNMARARLARDSRAYGDPIIEMMLVRVGDDWRIDTIDDYREEPGSPLVDKDVLEAWKAAADKTSPMEAQHKEDMPDPAAVFSASWACEALSEEFIEESMEWQEGDGDWDDPEVFAPLLAKAIEQARRNAEVGPVEIQEIGQFPHGSYLAVGDPFGEMCLCALRIDPGLARAQALLTTLGGERCVAALRVILADREPVEWKHAIVMNRRVYSTDVHPWHEVDTRSGNGTIADADAYFGMSHRQYSRVERQVEQTFLMDPGSGPIGASTYSGRQYGAAQAYWGLDEEGRPVQLVLDHQELWAPADPPGATA